MESILSAFNSLADIAYDAYLVIITCFNLLVIFMAIKYSFLFGKWHWQSKRDRTTS
ncbi:hypothetical protein KKC17_00495 [Patescibacteria group bacterium]|nr:hypothetical protein [Patescibacteria group bacterium]